MFSNKPKENPFSSSQVQMNLSEIDYNTEIENLKKSYSALLETNEKVISELEAEKKKSEGQIGQILRLNEEIARAEEEKQSLEKSLHMLQSSSTHPTDGYYQQEISRMITEKLSDDEAHKQEVEQLQQQLSGISVSPFQQQKCVRVKSPFVQRTPHCSRSWSRVRKVWPKRGSS